MPRRRPAAEPNKKAHPIVAFIFGKKNRSCLTDARLAIRPYARAPPMRPMAYGTAAGCCGRSRCGCCHRVGLGRYLYPPAMPRPSRRRIVLSGRNRLHGGHRRWTALRGRPRTTATTIYTRRRSSPSRANNIRRLRAGSTGHRRHGAVPSAIERLYIASSPLLLLLLPQPQPPVVYTEFARTDDDRLRPGIHFASSPSFSRQFSFTTAVHHRPGRYGAVWPPPAPGLRSSARPAVAVAASIIGLRPGLGIDRGRVSADEDEQTD
jgi:hypothetical protein